MQSEQQRRIMGYFIEEARDHLNTIEQGLLKLQATISDPDMANEVFRAAHSVKGGAAMLGLSSIQHTAHRLEDYFKVLKECPVQVDRRLENLLLNVFDTLRELLDQLQGPFGLTEDKAEEAMGSVEPVFAQLNQHIEQLVAQAGGTTPDDVDLSAPIATPASPIAVPQPVGTSAATEESAFQLIFQSDVPARLREMLNLFKQPEGAEPRRQIQEICQSLEQAGEQFDLVPWVDLLSLARRAIAHSDNMFRTLAPVIIREIKSAQELVLAGQSMSIAPGEPLLALVPPEPPEEEDMLESLDLFADDDSEIGTLELADMDSDAFLMEMPELDLEAEEPAGDVAAGAPAISADGTLIQDLDFDESPSQPQGNDNLAEGSANSDSERNGPAVGSAELNSLADLFETQSSPELSMNWEGEEVLPAADEAIPELLGADAGDDFSDLLQQGGLEDLLGPETEEDENLSDLLRQAEQSELRMKQQEASLDALLGNTSDDDFLAELGDLSLDGEAVEPFPNPASTQSAAEVSQGVEDFDSLFNESSDAVESEPDPLGGMNIGDEVADAPFMGSENDLFEESPAAPEGTESDAELGELGFLFGEESGEASDELGLDLGLDVDVEGSLQAEISDSDTDGSEIDTEDSLFDLSDLDLSDLGESEAEALDADMNPSVFDTPSVESGATAEAMPPDPTDGAGEEDLSWLDALDSDEGLENLPAAPAMWDEQAVDVTSDLWADATAPVVDVSSGENLSELGDQSQSIDPLEMAVAEELELSLPDEADTDALLAEFAQDDNPTDSYPDAQPEVENLSAVEDLDIEELAAIASNEISESLLEDSTTSELDLDLDALSEEPATVFADLPGDMSGLADQAADAAGDDFASLFGEDVEAEATSSQSENLDSTSEEAFDLDALMEEESDANSETSQGVYEKEDSTATDMSGVNDANFDALMGEAEASLFSDEEATDTTSDLDLDADFDALLDEAEIDIAPAASALPTSPPVTDAEGGDMEDLGDLDALLGEASELTDAADEDWSDLDLALEGAGLDEPQQASTTTPAGSEAADAKAAAADEDFAALDNLLDEPTPPPAVGGSAVSGGNDFSDLEALLSSDSVPPAPAPTPISSPPAEDEFGELEELLKAADSSMGGSPTVQGARSQSMTNRPTRTSGLRSDQTMRVSVKNLDNLNNLIGELVVNRNSLEQAEERLRQFLDNLQYQVQQLSDVGQRMRDLYERSLLESSLMSSRRSYQMAGRQGVPQDSGHATGASFDALEMDRFTGFHTLSQEMIELIVRVRESASDIDFVVGETDQVTRNFRQITSQLQESLTRARMVPFAQTADRLPRAVRDISMRCGKQAELVIEGRETLIDKMILEQLYDPMTHLVNNAITHGIETAEARVTQGKQPTGQIVVRAFHQGNQTVISVSDDGAGIDPDIVKQKAVERGLITQEQASIMNRLDVYDLLFHHGFSTRDRADDFAGRGIGMDVVRTSLNDIRGVINIDSNVGRGTTFTVRLPLTLSVSKALCCISNRARIAFPMDGVEDMLDVPADQVQTNGEGQACIQWRDQLLPFQALEDLLKFNRSLGRGSVYGGNQEEDIISVVVLRSNAGSYLALKVDQVLGEQEIVIKQLEGPVPKPVGIAGATVLGDGRIMPIADVLELIDLSMGRIRRESGTPLWEQAQEQIPVEPPNDTKSEPTVLIVDDSITVRELLSMTFNKVGYRVEQARDGQEAWEKLRSGLPCDLVFCDIEMPRMDGLELLSRLQKDTTLNNVPIAMLTSRGADRHRQMAIQLGAKGYFTKPYLEEVLLDAAQRMLTGEVLVDENGAMPSGG
ncbi:response regulator [Vacuolonema iberomarrocanum]|uniref:hybrid sensor histidine kinase/response regulator n=1 Tax=Vacuolonema iberomarrocanum TaxID=3454632 RepID=UPI001A082248|nr:response regulator [filamentous cyanobacterium LEGE 07170]